MNHFFQYNFLKEQNKFTDKKSYTHQTKKNDLEGNTK